jgi:hypothetical protein
MDSNQKFWVWIWGMVLAFLMGCFSCVTVLAWNTHDKWEKAVNNGADPMVIACALNGATTTGETAVCTILAQGRK